MQRHIGLIVFGLGLLCSFIWADPAFADRRVALVIGNSAYQHAPALPNPAKDARAMAAMFEQAGFAVVMAHYDANNLQFKSAIRQFEEAASEADIGVVYYAGHTINIHGMNYLIPVDAKLESDRDGDDEAITLDRLVESVDSAKRLRLVILDACRDNPFARTMRRLRVATVDPRMGRVQPTTINTLVAFAAKGCVSADDGDADHSAYTTALLNHLFVPGIDVRAALGRARDEVQRNTRNRQEPVVYGSLGPGDVSLVEPPEPAAPREQPAKQIAPHTRPKVALVIGNASYLDDKQPLAAPIKDARALAKELRGIGFDVVLGEDLGKENMRSVIDKFQAKIASDAIALFFFSGYGIQTDKQTYVIPIDARIRSEREISGDGFSVESMLTAMNGAGATVKMVIIDAARANPFEPHFRDAPTGLAPLAAPAGTLAIYSAAPNKVLDEILTAENATIGLRRSGASSGRCHRATRHPATTCSPVKITLRDAGSLFVSELLNEMRSPDLTAEEVFDSTRIKVSHASSRTQVPRVWSVLNDEFFFTAPTAAGPALAAASARPGAAPSKPGKQSTAPVFNAAARPADPAKVPEPMPTAAIPPAPRPAVPSARPAPPHGLLWWWPQWN
jgi:uncharacterized caspase-like protein